MSDDPRRSGRVPPGGHDQPRASSAEGGPPRDPYLDWTVATNYRYLPGPPDRDLPLLIKLRKGITTRDFAASLPADFKPFFRVPEIFLKLPDWLAPLEYVVASIKRGFEDRLFTEFFMKAIERFELSDPVAELEVPFDKGKLLASTTGPTPSAIVGVIDDGLPFANARFRDKSASTPSTSTRIEYLWNQDRSTFLSKADIDDYLKKSTHGGLVDEDEAYRRAGCTFAVSGHKSWARRATHGAHVMDLACGLDPAKVTPNSPRIIGVELPSAVTADPSSGNLEVYVALGLLYILVHADRVAAQYKCGPLPLVVNLSYGVNHGPHDGTALIEQLFDFLTAQRRLVSPYILVLAAGNSHLTRCHAHFRLAAALGVPTPRTLDWRVMPDDATQTKLEIWLPYDADPKQIEVTITRPDGSRLGPMKAGDPPIEWPSKAALVLRVTYPAVPAYGKRNVITLWLAPTTSLEAAAPVAPSGTWRITVTNVGMTPLCIDSWIWRDDTPFGYPIRGRQSRFEDADYVRFDAQGRLIEDDIGPSYVKRNGSMNGIATGSETGVIGGCRRTDLHAAPYTAGGPTLKPTSAQPAPRTGPDATAYAEWSAACRGMLATGTRSGSVVAVNGTSVSAPQVTRWIALRLAGGYPAYRPDIIDEGKNHPTPEISEKRGKYGYVEEDYSTIDVRRNAPL